MSAAHAAQVHFDKAFGVVSAATQQRHALLPAVVADKAPAMPEPLLKREGNLRFAGVASPGYPADPFVLVDQVCKQLSGLELVPHGPASVWFAVGPDEAPPSAWDCQVGMAVTGLPVPIPGVAVEDYRNLYALSLPHVGTVRDLCRTHQRLVAHAKTMGYHVRPYWRLALRERQLADGNLLPVADVAVFLDR